LGIAHNPDGVIIGDGLVPVVDQGADHGICIGERSVAEVDDVGVAEMDQDTVIGGHKSPDDPGRPNWNQWYDRYTPIADDLYDTHLDELRKEGLD